MVEGFALSGSEDSGDDGKFDPKEVMTLEEFMQMLDAISAAPEPENSDRWNAHELEQSLMMATGTPGAGWDKRTLNSVGDEDEEVEVFKTVHLKSKLFEGNAIPLYQMPGLKVLEIMLLPHEPVKMVKMVELLTTALSKDKEVDMLGVLSMHELNEILAQWVDKSQEAEEKKP